MPKNIVLLSDGTGNSAAKLFKTNVWRLYEALDRSDPAKQVAYYDDGIGTSSFRPIALLGGIFGFGLKRNVLDLYRFLCRNYEDGDRIYCFGFSRGAFTARVLAGLIAREGVIEVDKRDEARLASEAAWTYRDFRKEFNLTKGFVPALRWARDRLLGLRRVPAKRRPVPSIQFVGVWDTVAAYGGPIEEITRAIDHWVWPLSMPDRVMSGKIKRACHAMAIDDERNSFHPLLWDETRVHGSGYKPMYEDWSPPDRPNLAPIDQQRLSQVWFAGMHSDVGGGYAQDGLSFKTLQWMMDRAEVYGLALDPQEKSRLATRASHFDKLNDSRKGLGAYYRYKPRRIGELVAADPRKPALRRDFGRMVNSLLGRSIRDDEPVSPVPIVHESVVARIEHGIDGYAPIVLPTRYSVTNAAGEILPPVTHAEDFVKQQERAWDRVWARRVTYFLTLIATLYLLALPLDVGPTPAPENRDGVIDQFVTALQHVLPGIVAPWLEVVRAAPGTFAIGLGLVLTGLGVGRRLEGRIANEMRLGWHAEPAGRPRRDPREGRLYRLRTSAGYRGFFYALTHWIAPTLLAAGFYAGVLYVMVLLAGEIARFVGHSAA